MKRQISKFPRVTAKCAQTLDGKIATSNGQSQWITSKTSREYAHRLRNQFDAILVGINTVLKDDPRLNASTKSKHIKKIIVDSRLKTPVNARLFKQTRSQDVFIVTTSQANQTKKKQLLNKGINVLVSPVLGGKVNLKWLLKKLNELGIKNVLIEGGSEVIGSALKQKLVDRVFIFIAPKIIGDQRALSSVSGLRIRHVDDSICLKNIKIKKLKDDLFIEAHVYRNR